MYSKIKKSVLLRNILLVFSGAATAQAINLLAIPILSRFFNPAEFGIYGSVMAVASVIVAVSTLRYDHAMVLEKSTLTASALFSLSLACSIVISLLLVSIYLMLPLSMEVKNQLPWAGAIIYTIALVTSSFNILQYKASRESLYRIVASSIVVQRVTIAVSQISLGLLGVKSYGLAFGHSFGLSLAVGFIFIKLKVKSREFISTISDIRYAAVKHYRFATYSAPQNFINSLSQNIPVFFLSYYFDLATAGAYWFTVRILQMPVALLSQSMRQVVFKELSDKKDNIKGIRDTFNKTTILLMLISLPFAAFIFFLGQNLFSVAFGDQWGGAGQYARWMIIWIAIGMINLPATSMLIIYDKQKLSLVIEVCMLLLRSIALVIGGIYYDSVTTVALYSLAGALVNLYIIIHAYLLVSYKPNAS